MRNYHTTQKEIEERMQLLDEAIATNGKKAWTFARMRKTVFSTLSSLLFVFMTIILLHIWIQRANGETPSFLSHQIYRVETGSMIPTFPIGSVIVSKEYNGSSNLLVGEIVTFQRGEQVITHRIVEVITSVNGEVYRTKGDNPENDIDAEVLTKDNVIAIYRWSFPFIIQFHMTLEVMWNG